MASNILETLQKINNDRMTFINTAKNMGYDINNDGSILSLMKVIQPKPEPPQDIPTYNIPPEELECIEREDWVRPEEWPDCHNILLNTERVNIIGSTNYYEPFVIMLLKCDDDVTIIPMSRECPNQNTQRDMNIDYFTWTRVLTSDGTSYTTNNIDIEHTWDKTKDIVLSDGTYRYLIFYKTSNSDNGQCNIVSTLPVVEVIVDYINTNQNVGRSAFMHFSNISKNTLINVEIYNLGTKAQYWYPVSADQRRTPMFDDCINLRNLYIEGEYNNSNDSAYRYDVDCIMFRGCKKLRHLDLSDTLVQLKSNNNQTTPAMTIDLSYCYSLIDIKLPKCISNNTSYHSRGLCIRLGYNPLLNKIEDSGNDIRCAEHEISWGSGVQSYYGNSVYGTYCPINISVIGNFITKSIPLNWNGHDYTGINKLFSSRSYGYVPHSSSTFPYHYLCSTLGNGVERDILDFSNIYTFSNKTATTYGICVNSNSQYSLFKKDYIDMLPPMFYKGIIILPIIRTRLTFDSISIGSYNMQHIINQLDDLNTYTENVYNPVISFNKRDERFITPELIQIATDKGWTITFK